MLMPFDHKLTKWKYDFVNFWNKIKMILPFIIFLRDILMKWKLDIKNLNSNYVLIKKNDWFLNIDLEIIDTS